MGFPGNMRASFLATEIRRLFSFMGSQTQESAFTAMEEKNPMAKQMSQQTSRAQDETEAQRCYDTFVRQGGRNEQPPEDVRWPRRDPRDRGEGKQEPIVG